MPFNCKSSVFAAALVLLTAGCATQPVGISTDQMAKLHEQGVAVGSVKGASAITLHTKAKAIGGTVMGMVAGSAVASSPASVSPQGLQQAQEAGAITSGLVAQAVDEIGNDVKQAQTPAMAMADVLHQTIAGEPHLNDAAYHIDIVQAQWMLDYDSLFGTDNYRLHWKIHATVRDRDDKVVTASTCQGDGDIKQALETWEANDYAQVKEAARHIGTDCARQLLRDIGFES